MRARGPAVGFVICLASLLLPATHPAEAQGGPLPDFGSADAFFSTVDDEAAASQAVVLAYADAAEGHSADIVDAAQDQVIAASSVIALIEDTADAGAAVITNAGQVVVAGIAATDGVADALVAYSGYWGDVAVRALGIGPSSSFPFIDVGSYGPCVTDVQAALDAAEPGDHVVVCAGSYGPLVVTTEFVTLRSEQGAGATFVDGAGATGIDVRASGVRVLGFTVENATGPGEAGIRIGATGDLVDDEVAGVVVAGNVVRDNANGIMLHNASAALIVDNTIMRSRMVGPADGFGVGVGPAGGAASALGGHATVVAANNFFSNQGLAVGIVGGAPSPVFALWDHYGAALPPAVEVAPGMCTTLVGVPGSAPCSNGIGIGVVMAGWSPVEW